ncbi:MAG: DpnD protein [Epsilonproteobacteria bacterium]|nr:DpnD protein [Campylobacterota bacterium]
MKVNVRVTELLIKVVSVEAKDENEAIIAVERMYNDEKIILDYSDFNGNVSIEIDEQVNEL